MRVGVVYLARSTDGSSRDFVKFAESYNKHTAGMDHDLIIIFKGEARRLGTKLATKLMFKDANITSLDFSDTDGFDIHAYLHASKILPHDYLCFLNTYSTICADGWLSKLMAPHLNDVKCGVTGATASYESLYDSYSLLTKAIWLAATDKIPFDHRLASQLSDELTMHAPNWMAKRLSSSASYGQAITITPEVADAAEQHWVNATKSTGSLAGFNLFKPFPNPHIRSNGWVIRRELLNSLGITLGPRKIDCCQFESGITGLPTLLAERGLKQILVGANGQAYEVDEWLDSKGFRLSNQENILIRDNQVAVYDNITGVRRSHLSMLSWGEYLAPTPEVIKNMGFAFQKGNTELTHVAWPRAQSDGNPIRISIVIPTHNRRSLVMEALYSIVRQPYRDWECVVFDNCSDEPVEELVQTLGDSRIRVVRSDVFLPVTESWNRAIDQASGDYVCLLGDDDGLSPSYMTSVSYIAYHKRPDFIYNSLFQFFHPGVAPWEPSGYVSDLRSGPFFKNEGDFFELDTMRAQQAAAASLKFRRSFTFNMQAFCFDRNFLNSLRKDGKVFHSPFPDYYLANIAFGLAKRIIIAPKPISIAGVSRKSFGYTLFNNLEKVGAELLATKLEKDPLYASVADLLLPGPDYVTNYFLTMKHVEARLGKFTTAETAVSRYRRLQILSNILPDPVAAVGLNPLNAELAQRLTAEEQDWIAELDELVRAAPDDALARRTLINIHGECQMYGPAPMQVKLDIGSYPGLPSLYRAMEEGVIAAADMWT